MTLGCPSELQYLHPIKWVKLGQRNKEEAEKIGSGPQLGSDYWLCAFLDVLLNLSGLECLYL